MLGKPNMYGAQLSQCKQKDLPGGHKYIMYDVPLLAKLNWADVAEDLLVFTESECFKF